MSLMKILKFHKDKITTGELGPLVPRAT